MKIKFEQLELNLAMDEEKIIQKEKDAGIPVVGILKRKSRKPAMAAKKKNGDQTGNKASAKGQPDEADHYRNGQAKFQDRDGIRTIYFMDGNIKARGPFDGKNLQGEWQFFKNTTRLWQIGHYKDGLKDGKWMRFTDEGVIEKKQNFKDDEILKD
ncbi:hypothetical protein OEOE_1304 [Oenococcus oeni PSU-1]|uniref:MORN repeat protein n=2 Tax=Oenococcus oeni TaxID=1247 RepID=Q04EE6_OENOB|nr:hypothetical protein [Oenococcus oeni]ABJ57176.1 hypothetical protein OEOE_1304 [Oenococcus oeni PSU-1]KEP86790.1 hypothetical protein X278_00935 [Oenococcus oeni IOEB_0205]